MTSIDLHRLLNEPIYAMNFQFMLADLEDFLNFSEINIERQHQRELESIRRRADSEDFQHGYEGKLKDDADHRFKVSLPLRVRYGALIMLTTSVEWSIEYISQNLDESLENKPKDQNNTVYRLNELSRRTGIERNDLLLDYGALVKIRNCITHNAGFEEGYKYRKHLPKALSRLSGFSLGNWHFLGKQICIEKAAIIPYLVAMKKLVVELHKAAHEKGLMRDDT